MSKIDLKNFVDINIQRHILKDISGTRNTVVLFTNDALALGEYSGQISFYSNTYNTIEVTIKDYKTKFAGKTNTLQYLAEYFNNGGIKALVICEIDIDDMIHETDNAIDDEILSVLDNEYIYIAYASPKANLETNYGKLKNIAIYRNSKESIYGINEKIIIAGTHLSNDTNKIKNFAVKYSEIQGAEMTIAAYFSKTRIYRTNSIYDYAFTQENLVANIAEDYNSTKTYNIGDYCLKDNKLYICTTAISSAEAWNIAHWALSNNGSNGDNISDETFKEILNNNMNVDINLAETVRNCGGNNKDGEDLINNFVRIILHQTLTDSLINLLTQKIKNSSGISKIYSVIAQELEKYLNNGYLTTDKIWTDDDLVIDYNNSQFTIIEKGTALTNGYIIKVLPMSALTIEDRTSHNAPPIYIILADQYGIRKITISGEVI